MGRSHVWVQRGEEYVESRPVNWGDNLTLVGAIRRDGWVVLNTQWRAMTKRAFIAWVRRRLAPRLRHGDIVLLDNLSAHKAPEVRCFIEARGATVKSLPPYSYDFNPIEPAWSLAKKRIRGYAPRTAVALRRVARAARHVVTPYHCRQYFAHAGYGHASGNRDEVFVCRGAQDAQCSSDPELSPYRLRLAVGIIDQDEIGANSLGKSDRRTFAGVQPCSNRLCFVSGDRDDVHPGRRLSDPRANRVRRSRRSQFIGNRFRDKDGAVQVFEKRNVLDENEVVEGTGVGDDNHRSRRIPSSRCTRRSFSTSASVYFKGTRWSLRRA